MKKLPWQNLLVRTFSGIVFVAVILGSVMFSAYGFLIILMLLTAGCLWEFYGIASKAGSVPLRWAVVAGPVVVATNFIAAYVELPGNWGAAVVSLGLLIPLFLPFVLELFRGSANPMMNVSTTVAGLLYIAVPYSLFLWIPVIGNETYRPLIVIGYMFVIWANDVGAYLVGVTLGKHRLFPRISPKKTWEGLAGGILAAIGIAFLVAWMNGQSYLFWVGFAVVAVAGAVFGDLIESMFKRSVEVKDSGNVMPGHGGFLDRLDALLFSLPFAFIYFIIFAR